MLQKIKEAPTRTVSFYNEVKAEMKKVTWPSSKEVYGTTTVVLIAVFFFGLYLFLVDSILQVIINRIFEVFT